MALNLSGGLSSEDLDKQRMIQNPPRNEPGFGGVSSVGFSSFDDDDDDDSLSFSSSFGDDDDDDNPFSTRTSFDGLGSGMNSSPFNRGSGFNSNPFGSSSGGLGGGMNSSPFSSSPFSSGSSFNSGLGGNSSFGSSSPFGNSYGSQSFGMGVQNQQKSDDTADKVFAGIKEFGSFLLDIFSSVRTRTIDDWAELSNFWITTGGIMMGVGLVSTLVGLAGDISLLKLGGLGGSSFFGGGFVLATGCVGLGVMAYLRAENGEYAKTAGDTPKVTALAQPESFQMNDIESSFGFDNDNSDEDFEEDEEEPTSGDDVTSILNELFGESKDEPMSFPMVEPPKEPEIVEKPKDIDYNNLVSSVRSDVGYVNRGMLFDTFKDFFPTCSTKFADVHELDPSDMEFTQMGAKINKALEQLLPKALPEVREVQIESIRETHFAYEITFSRIKDKSLKLNALADELVNHFKSDINDDSISVTINTLGDKNIAIITKGESSPVTVGDCLLKDNVENYIRDSKHKLPFISGITELGDVEMSDMKDYLTLIMTGKPRSGKSWYVNSILTTLAAFNTPEEIQFIIIDPKKTALFKTFSLLPHVCGLHDGTEILSIFKDILESEAERRKKLLSDAEADNIWDYMEETGVKLPVIMIVIDEIVTIYNDLKQQNLHKEFTSYIQQILTQLPFIGIGLMMVPHRTTGILDPLTRMNVSYKAAVMADSDSIKEELGVSGWDRPLVLPGDMAITTSRWKSPKYLKGTGVALKDKDTRTLIKEMAKAWYKIGVELPDVSMVGVGVNRNETYVQQELKLSDKSNRIQYDTLNLDD